MGKCQKLSRVWGGGEGRSIKDPLIKIHSMVAMIAVWGGGEGRSIKNPLIKIHLIV